MNTLTIEDIESKILARVIAPDAANLPPAVALELLKWGFSKEDQLRMTELAAKARQGTLTADEQTEAEGYERVSSFLGLVNPSCAHSSYFQAGNSAVNREVFAHFIDL